MIETSGANVIRGAIIKNNGKIWETSKAEQGHTRVPSNCFPLSSIELKVKYKLDLDLNFKV